MKRPLAARALVLVMVIAVPAQAQRGEPAGEPPGEETGNTLDDEARSLFEAGRTAYAGGRYRAAYDYFAQAYRLSQRLGLLYNMAQAADRARLDAEALEAYRTFLEARPDTAERVMIEQRIHDLSSSAPRTPEPAEPERDEPSPTPPSGGPGPAPWILVGAGAAVVIAGGILLTMGLLDRSSVEGAPRDTVWADVAGAYDRAPALMITGDVMIGAGLAAVAAGIVWAVVAPSDAPPSVSFGVGPGGLAVRGRFDVAQ